MCVAVVDDDEVTCAYFRDILQGVDDFHCAGCFSNAPQALIGIAAARPDLVLMDTHLPGINGIECTKRLKSANPNLKIVMVTASDEPDLVEQSLEAGADAILMKPITPEQCVAALKFAIGKRLNEGAGALQNFSSALSLIALLTAREKQVMQYLADGLLYKEIADKIGVSFSTVHKHQHNIFRKLGTTNRTEAVRKWLDAGQSWS